MAYRKPLGKGFRPHVPTDEERIASITAYARRHFLIDADPLTFRDKAKLRPQIYRFCANYVWNDKPMGGLNIDKVVAEIMYEDDALVISTKEPEPVVPAPPAPEPAPKPKKTAEPKKAPPGLAPADVEPAA